MAEELDQLGFHSAWVCDHVYGVPAAEPADLRGVDASSPRSRRSRARVELGTLVTPPFFRNPAILAKQIATLDQISGGRAIAGLGAGWFEAEFDAAPAARSRRSASA